MDNRLKELNKWQMEVYHLAWQCGLKKDRSIGKELEKRKKAHPEQYKAVMKVFSEICLEVLN